MKREIMRDREKLKKIVADADSYLAMISDALEVGDVNEDEFKQLTTAATKAVIIKAAVNSLEVMQ